MCTRLIYPYLFYLKVSLFYGTFSATETVSSSERAVSDDKLERIWKERSWPDFKVLHQNLRGGADQNRENLSQDMWYPGRYLKSGSSICEAAMLTTRIQRSVRLPMLRIS